MEVTLGESLTMTGRRGAGFGAGDEIEEHVDVGAERDASVFGVGAGGVDLVGGDAFRVVETIDDSEVVVDGVAEDVDDDGAGGIGAQGRELVGDEFLDADILQADGVDHACGGFDEARGLVAGHGLGGNAFGDKAADAAGG